MHGWRADRSVWSLERVVVLLVAWGSILPVLAAADEVTRIQLAQFELPQRPPAGEPPPLSDDAVISRHRLPEALPGQLPQRLKYQYSIGSESEINYRRDRDLNERVRDDALILKPQVNGIVSYRPTDWLAMTLEMILEREIPAKEEQRIVLPNGETQIAQKRHTSLLVDQAYVTIKALTTPLEFSLGRRNYEDERHWLYDTSMDIASVEFKKGALRAEALVGREVLWDMDLLTKETTDRINTYLLHLDYRGIEDIKLAGYVLFRDDRTGKEGRPLHIGVSALGVPSENFSFWTQLAGLRGRDESKQRFSAFAFDVGATYRWTGLRLSPNVTLGYAFATGDSDSADNKNTEFRQSGLQSNEARLAGFSKFKVYGETLDPELSNLHILTVGLGLRPAPSLTLDLVYHQYWLDKIADAIRNSELTALMNQDDTRISKRMGKAIDVVLGIRNLFGVRRLGMDLRAGWFFPGRPFRIEEGDPNSPTFRKANKGISMVAKFWY